MIRLCFLCDRYMMENTETPKAPRMKLVAGPSALAALIGVALLWKSGENSSLLSMGMVAGVALGSIAVVGVVAMWLRNRSRRELRSMRDSALW